MLAPLIFRLFSKIAEGFDMSVRLFVRMEQLGPNLMDFHEI